MTNKTRDRILNALDGYLEARAEWEGWKRANPPSHHPVFVRLTAARRELGDALEALDELVDEPIPFVVALCHTCPLPFGHDGRCDTRTIIDPESR